MEVIISHTLEDNLLDVIKNTTNEINRVLNIWQHDHVKRDYNDYKSLFRTYFFKYMNNKFGWSKINYLKYTDILPVIISNRLTSISINISEFETRDLLVILKKVINNFDYNDHYLNNKPKDYLKDNNSINLLNTIPTVESINFDNIINIKF